MEVDVAYNAIKEILAEAGFKIYTPNWKYHRMKPAILAVKAGPGRESAYLIKQWKGKLLVGWLQPGYEHKGVHHRLKTEFPKKLVRFRPRLLYPFRHDQWEHLWELVTPRQQAEFHQLTYGTPLTHPPSTGG